MSTYHAQNEYKPKDLMLLLNAFVREGMLKATLSEDNEWTYTINQSAPEMNISWQLFWLDEDCDFDDEDGSIGF